MALRLSAQQLEIMAKQAYSLSAVVCQYGAGAGKSGGTGGSIRDAGGSFGKMEAAREEQYFRKLNSEKIQLMKDEIARLDEMTEAHESEVEWHAWVIENNKKRLSELAVKLDAIVE